MTCTRRVPTSMKNTTYSVTISIAKIASCIRAAGGRSATMPTCSATPAATATRRQRALQSATASPSSRAIVPHEHASTNGSRIASGSATSRSGDM